MNQRFRLARLLQMPNPAGEWVLLKMQELGISRDSLAAEVGTSGTALSNYRYGYCPSFSTDVGRRVAAAIAREERNRPELLSPTDVKNPARRAQVIHDGLFIWSHCSNKMGGKGEDNQFRALEQVISPPAYRGALVIMAETIFGSIPEGGRTSRGTFVRPEHGMGRSSARRAFVRRVIELEKLPQVEFETLMIGRGPDELRESNGTYKRDLTHADRRKIILDAQGPLEAGDDDSIADSDAQLDSMSTEERAAIGA